MEQFMRQAKKHCIGLLSRSRCSCLPYHNIEHTMEVYENVLKIGMYENRNFEQLEPVLLAALFHDIGNAVVFTGHENYSATEAGNFLRSKQYSEAKIAQVVDCINATRLPQKPNNEYEKIICDADLFHIGTTSFQSKNNSLRWEWAKFLDDRYTDKEWDALNIKFLEKHRFQTKYGQEVLEPVKQVNLKELLSATEETSKPT